MDNVQKYEIVTATSVPEITKQVQLKLDYGWQIHGVPYVFKEIFLCQCVVLKHGQSKCVAITQNKKEERL